MPEYSYYFAMRSFLPVLRRFAIVAPVVDPKQDVDAIYQNARAHGEQCVFLSFAPPHHTVLDLSCPTIPVFAWEFEAIPNEVWWGDVRNDWRNVFKKTGRAITHSTFTVRAVRKVMGEDFPIISAPSPLWDKLGHVTRDSAREPLRALRFNAKFIDSRTTNLESYSWLNRPCPSAPPDGLHGVDPCCAKGVIYTSVFNPYDGRKNWFDLVSAFCIALRDEEDATLILKLTHHDTVNACNWLLDALYRLSPFRCRIIIVRGFVSDEDYEQIVRNSTYAVNASTGEGQCLPLMELMSGGAPAIAPRHTAMLDYITPRNAFVVRTSLEPSAWPHDWRGGYRTLRHRLDVHSLVQQYRESFRVATQQPGRYREMSRAARDATKEFCAMDIVEARLRPFLQAAAARAPVRQDA